LRRNPFTLPLREGRKIEAKAEIFRGGVCREARHDRPLPEIPVRSRSRKFRPSLKGRVISNEYPSLKSACRKAGNGFRNSRNRVWLKHPRYAKGRAWPGLSSAGSPQRIPLPELGRSRAKRGPFLSVMCCIPYGKFTRLSRWNVAETSKFIAVLCSPVAQEARLLALSF
jgi:hypothetical protein